MNEKEISRLMDAYKGELGSCSRTPLPKRRWMTWKRGSLAVAATLAIAGALFFLLPEDAAAQAVKRVSRALKSVKTMRVSTTMFRNGQWKKVSSTFMKDGMWRTEAFYGSALAGFFLMRDDKLLTSYDQLPHATLQPKSVMLDDWVPTGDMSVLDYVTEWATNFGSVGDKREISLAESAPVDGRATYKIVMKRPADSYSAEIIVDAATELPIRSSYQFNGGQAEKSRQEYAFNESLDDDLFSFSIGKPVIDLDKEQEQLGREWQTPLAQVGNTKVRDVSVTEDGTVWVAVSNDKFKPGEMMPTQASSDAEVSYLRYGRDIDVSAVWGKKRAKINGEEVLVVGFIASDPLAGLPKQVKVDFAPRGQLTPGFSGDAPQSSQKAIQRSFIPRREAGRFPAYFITLDLDHFCFQLWPQIQSNRAKYLFDQGEFLAAGQQYEAAARAYEGFIKRLGTRELKEAVKSYEKANRPDLAAKAEAWHARLYRETHPPK